MTNIREVKLPLDIEALKAGREIEVPVLLGDDEENFELEFKLKIKF